MSEIIPGFAEFELDLTEAIKNNLPSILDSISHVALTQENVSALPNKVQGVYMLFYQGIPVYFGKTDSQHGFKDRLGRHAKTILHRKNLDASKVNFKCVRVMVFTVVNVEDAMIKHYSSNGGLSWQKLGFGSNDPGHRRETQEASEFDKQFPVNIDVPLESVQAGSHNAFELLTKIRPQLPYVFRFEKENATVEFNINISLPSHPPTLRDILTLLVSQQSGWVATHFPGRVILYKETTKYSDAIAQI